jgi:hypothetical protein
VSSLVPVVFAVGVAAFVALAAYSWWADQRRREQLMAFCRSKGWSFAPEDPSLVGRWTGTPFGQGERRRARQVVTGTDRARSMVAFDYSYVTSSTDSKGQRSETTHRFAVVVLALPTWLPRLQLTPESLLSRAAAAVGLDPDIELESEDFNRRYRVSARQPKFASDVLTPRTMQALLARPATAMRIDGNVLMSWEGGQLEPVGLLSRLATLHAFVDGIPGFVWKDHGYDPGVGPSSVTPQPGGSAP